MAFRVTARTLLHLGAELISSDAIAFYELIKNAFDAGSERVIVHVVTRLPYDDYRVFKEKLSVLKQSSLNDEDEKLLEQLRSEMLAAVDYSAPGASRLKSNILHTESIASLYDALVEANYITIKDKGEGMSLRDLDDVYLTIGTRSRLKQRDQHYISSNSDSNTRSRTVLGEKGIGRLSAMRLGQRLKVRTSKTGEPRWNSLWIDWSWFSHDSDALIHEINISPSLGNMKDAPEECGTTIRISELESRWSKDALEKIAREEFSRLIDPFGPRARNPITLKYNNDSIYIPPVNTLLFEHAHAHVNACFFPDEKGQPVLAGNINYCRKHREKTFDLAGVHLMSASDSTPDILKRLGEFSVEFYWYNRSWLKAIDGIGELKQVRDLQAMWAGGLMLFRDGFRVNPYGSPEDDWLDLDKKAFASGGYKVNRRQIIGKVEISASGNPFLSDQTNREGLRDCDEKRALVGLLRHILTEEFKTFIESVDQETQPTLPASFDELEERVELQEKRLTDNLQELIRRHPEVEGETTIVCGIRETIGEVRLLMDEADRLAKSYQKGGSQMAHLAGLGLMVEIVAHELNRATEHALSTLGESIDDSLPEAVASTLGTLEVQLKTIKKRLSILDPLSTTQRQTKETFDLVSWVAETMQAHEGQFERHHIRYEISAQPGSTLNVKAVKGMIVQVLENLISNSVYWLKQQARLEPGFSPEIRVEVDTVTKEIWFSDNGPGVASPRREEIFEPFVTTKPPGEGKGLGLFISREIANYNNAVLYLSDIYTAHADALNTFVLALEGKTQ